MGWRFWRSKSASSVGHSFSASPTTTLSQCASASSGRAETCMPPMTTLMPRAPEMVRDLIGALHGGGHGGDADQVGFRVQVQRLHLFIDDVALPARRGERGDLQQAQVGHAEEERSPHEAPGRQRRDQQQTFHGSDAGAWLAAVAAARSVESSRGNSRAGRPLRAGGAGSPGWRKRA